jgi:hypothetical protein
MNAQETAYIPGVCNINTDEIARRRKIGHIGIVVFIVVFGLFLLGGFSRYYRIILFLPAFLTATGYLQAHNRFCVGYAAAGEQNAMQGSKEASKVSNKTAIAADKHKAHRMNLQALVIAVAMVLLAFII